MNADTQNSKPSTHLIFPFIVQMINRISLKQIKKEIKIDKLAHTQARKWFFATACVTRQRAPAADGNNGFVLNFRATNFDREVA